MKKGLFIFMLIVLASLAAAGMIYARKDILIQKKIERLIENVTGVQVEIFGLESSDFGTKVRIEQILIKNPAGWEHDLMAQIGDILITAEKPLWLPVDPAIENAEAVIKKIVIRQNQAMQTNLAVLKAVSDAGLSSESPPFFQIKKLKYHLGQVMLFENIPGDEKSPILSEFDYQGRMEEYYNVTHPDVLALIPVIKAVEITGKGSLGLRRGKILEKIDAFTGS